MKSKEGLKKREVDCIVKKSCNKNMRLHIQETTRIYLICLDILLNRS